MNKLNLVSLPICFVFLVCLSPNTWADTFSKPGVDVTITLSNGLFGRTEQGDISGSYQTQNTEGILFAAPQATTGSLGESDIAYFNFVDTQDQDRCYGSASLSSGGINIWEIKGAVPGYSCLTVGEVYRFNFGR